MKRLFAGTLLLLILFTFAACGENKNTSTDAQTTAQAETTLSVSDSESETQNERTTQNMPEKKIFKVGIIVPENDYGAQIKNGALLAAQNVNEGGEIQLQINFSSEGKNGETASEAYDELKAWGMQILVGPVTSNGAETVAVKSNTDRIFQIVLCDDKLTGYDNVIDFCSSDNDKALSLQRYIYDVAGLSKVAVIYQSDNDEHKNLHDDFIGKCENAGVGDLLSFSFTKDTAHDFSVQLSSCVNNSVEAVVLVADNQDSALILEQAEAMGFSPQFIGTEKIEKITSVENFKKEFAKTLVCVTPFSLYSDDSDALKFSTQYTEMYTIPADKGAAYGFDSVNYLCNLIIEASAKSTSENEKICKKLVSAAKENEYDAITGGNMLVSQTGEFLKNPSSFNVINMY